jgi:hypothetical protein
MGNVLASILGHHPANKADDRHADSALREAALETRREMKAAFKGGSRVSARLRETAA